MAALRADHAIIPTAIEEILRMHNSIRNVDRYTLHDVKMQGVKIPAGALVVVWLSAANRDPAVFDQPDTFIPGRSPNRHLAFGQGIHMCLGAPLARMEAQLVAKAILSQTRAIELTAEPVRGCNANFDSINCQMARFQAV